MSRAHRPQDKMGREERRGAPAMKTLFHSHPPFSSTPFSLSPLLDHRRRLRRLRTETGFNVAPTVGEGGFKRGRWGIREK